jgi:hypothetical protein
MHVIMFQHLPMQASCLTLHLTFTKLASLRSPAIACQVSQTSMAESSSSYNRNPSGTNQYGMKSISEQLLIIIICQLVKY